MWGRRSLIPRILSRLWRVGVRTAALVIGLIPFIGRLDVQNVDAWKKTSIQTVVSVVLSSIPIWAAITTLVISNSELETVSAVAFATSHGELLLLSASAVSPIIYITSARFSRPHPSAFITSFPHGAFYLLSVVVVLIVCAVFLTLRSLQLYANEQGISLTYISNDLTTISFYLYAFSLFLYFTANFHKNSADRVDGTSLNRPAENSFAEEWEKRGE